MSTKSDEAKAEFINALGERLLISFFQAAPQEWEEADASLTVDLAVPAKVLKAIASFHEDYIEQLKTITLEELCSMTFSELVRMGLTKYADAIISRYDSGPEMVRDIINNLHKAAKKLGNIIKEEEQK